MTNVIGCASPATAMGLDREALDLPMVTKFDRFIEIRLWAAFGKIYIMISLL